MNVKKNSPADLLVKLSKVSKKKTKAYGPQQALVKLIFDKIINNNPVIIRNGEDAWKFHLLMEIISKNLRLVNLYVNKDNRLFESLIDSLEDESVYCCMLATELRRKEDE